VDDTLAQTNPEFVKKTFASIATRYDFANHLLSGGLDFLWRKKLAARVAALAPTEILDLATGSGDLALALAKANPRAIVTAADFCLPMLEMARLKRVPNLVQADGLALPFPDGFFDVVTVAFGLRNMADWGAAIEEMHRVLRPGGAMFIMDFSMPESPLVLPFYRLYLHRVLPLLAELATGRREAYEYLGGSIESFPAGLAMNSLMKARGFQGDPPQTLAFGAVSIYCGKVPMPPAAKPAS
jgi:demethylmenaquinone methyltransferase / 2-methoxy-6-polyprenyl-1,4-benzoquinol methylase